VTGFELKPGSRSGRILIILHQETSSSGRVGQLLGRMGYRADIRRPVLGDPLPDHLDDHAGVVVFRRADERQ
jgi:GMP synthase (glutamine-hydrolysing)